VRSSDVGGANAIPFRVVADFGQVSDHSLHSPVKQSCHVFHEREVRSYHANAASHLSPESRTGAGYAGALAGVAEILTGEAARDNAAILSNAGKLQSERKTANSCEQVYVLETFKIFIGHHLNIALVHDARRESPLGNALAQHRRAVRVDFVVIVHHSPLCRGSRE